MNRRKMLRGLLGVGGLMDVAHASRNAERIEVGGSTLDVFIDSDQFEFGRTALLDWVTRCANAVTAYFGRFPVAHARVYISVSENGRVSNGVSYGDGGAHCRISVGRHATLKDLYNDWELTHEMVHFSFPSVADHHHWIEEGIATYVEPIARIRAGHLTAEHMWLELVRDMPQGLPEAGDRGLDHTHTWGRTYWGGALFCLLGDVEIRSQTNNTKGLQHALRGILDAGGDIREDWILVDALRVGDRAVGVSVLQPLYARMKDRPVGVDLDALWAKLGVQLDGAVVRFDNSAVLADIRQAITAGESAIAEQSSPSEHLAVFAGRAVGSP